MFVGGTIIGITFHALAPKMEDPNAKYREKAIYVVTSVENVSKLILFKSFWFKGLPYPENGRSRVFGICRGIL